MAGRPCKVCGLKKTHKEAYSLISEEIKKPKGKAKIKQLLNTLKERFELKVNGVNIHRHKEHLAKAAKKKAPLNGKKPPKKQSDSQGEMEVYSPEGELLYTNIQEIIDDMDESHKLFCEAFVNTYNHNATGSYQHIYECENYGTAATQASRLLKNLNVTLYINHLIDERSKNLKISSSFVLTGLMENYSRCMQAEQVLDRDGCVTGIYNFNPNAANKALELIGKHLQMWDKKTAESLDKEGVYKQIIEKLLHSQINPIEAGLEMDKLGRDVPEALKIIMRNDKGKDPETDDHGLKSRIKKRMDKLKNVD